MQALARIGSPMLNFAKQNEQALLKFLNHLSRRDAVLDYHQIQGLLYAMACSPEPIKPAEWFELIWLSDEPQFDDAGEAKTFYRLLLELSQDIGEAARQERYRPAIAVGGTCSVAALVGWCDGFLTGHQYLENLWIVALDTLDDDNLYEQVAATLDWAAAFIGGDIVDLSVEDNDEGLLAACLQFQQMLGEYYSVHRQWTAEEGYWDAEQSFAAMRAVGRDETCPCGSGRTFGRCCLH
jgi:yecA family protein